MSNNPDSVTRILKAVFNLPKVRQDEFSQLLGNIIGASSLVANRIVALKVLREIVFEPKRRRTIKERGELDVLVRDNTWMFGEGFHLTMVEAGLTQIMDRVSEDVTCHRTFIQRMRLEWFHEGRTDDEAILAYLDVLKSTLPFLLQGLLKTIAYSLAAIVLGSVLGCGLGLVRSLHLRGIDQVIGLYLHLFRGSPFLVQLYVVYFVLPNLESRWSRPAPGSSPSRFIRRAI